MNRSRVTVLGLVGGAPGPMGGRHRASPSHRRRARAASFITAYLLSLEPLAARKTLGIQGDNIHSRPNKAGAWATRSCACSGRVTKKRRRPAERWPPRRRRPRPSRLHRERRRARSRRSSRSRAACGAGAPRSSGAARASTASASRRRAAASSSASTPTAPRWPRRGGARRGPRSPTGASSSRPTRWPWPRTSSSSARRRSSARAAGAPPPRGASTRRSTGGASSGSGRATPTAPRACWRACSGRAPRSSR